MGRHANIHSGEVDAFKVITNEFQAGRNYVSGDQNTKEGDTVLGIDTDGGSRTVTLSTRDLVDGRVIIVKDESGNASGNNITIATEGSAQIDGAAPSGKNISSDYGKLRLYSDGSNWFEI